MRKLVEAKQQTKLSGHRWEVTCLEFSPSGLHLASSAWDKEVRLWDLSTLETCGFLTNQHEFPITSLAWKPGESSNILATTSSDHTACIWNTNTGTVLNTLEHENWVLDCSFNLEGTRLATGCWDKNLRIWDVETAKTVNSFTGHSSGIWTCEFCPVSPHIVCSGTEDGALKVFDTRSSSLVLSLVGGHEDSVKCCAWSTDGKYLASGGVDMKIVVWDASAGNALTKLRGHEDTIMDLKFYPFRGGHDMPFILSTGDNTCRFWSAMKKRNQEFMCLKQHENGSEVQCLAVSQDGTLIATGGRDTHIILSSLNVMVDEVEAISLLSDEEVTVGRGAQLWRKYTKKLLQRISVSGSESNSSDNKSSEDEDSNSDSLQQAEYEDTFASAATMVGAAVSHHSHGNGIISEKTVSRERAPSDGTLRLQNKISQLRHIDENDNIQFNGLPAPEHVIAPTYHPEETMHHPQPSANRGLVFHHKNQQDKPVASVSASVADGMSNGVVTHNSVNNGVVTHHSVSNGVIVHHGKRPAVRATLTNEDEVESRL